MMESDSLFPCSSGAVWEEMEKDLSASLPVLLPLFGPEQGSLSMSPDNGKSLCLNHTVFGLQTTHVLLA